MCLVTGLRRAHHWPAFTPYKCIPIPPRHAGLACFYLNLMGCFSGDLWDALTWGSVSLPAVFTLHLSDLRDHPREWVTEQTEGFWGRPVVRVNGSSVFILFLLLESGVGFFPVGFNSSFKVAFWGSLSVGILCDDCTVCPCCCNVCLITCDAALPLLN